MKDMQRKAASDPSPVRLTGPRNTVPVEQGRGDILVLALDSVSGEVTTRHIQDVFRVFGHPRQILNRSRTILQWEEAGLVISAHPIGWSTDLTVVLFNEGKARAQYLDLLSHVGRVPRVIFRGVDGCVLKVVSA